MYRAPPQPMNHRASFCTSDAINISAPVLIALMMGRTGDKVARRIITIQLHPASIQKAKSKDEGGRRKDEVKAFKTGKHSFHPSSFILHPCFSSTPKGRARLDLEGAGRRLRGEECARVSLRLLRRAGRGG